jgi:hypothetical protein
MQQKFIAFYLPQFHTIPENDEWWGKGFTEWIRVKNSRPLFSGHNQPRVPYSYYDLADVNAMVHQAEMAKAFGINAFCYYHYWFMGKKLLENPLEQMLKCEQVDIPFCLSWANESWTRAWEGKSKEILIKQEYGNEEDWGNHLNYLIKYFRDKRYIKIEDKPVLLIYRTESYKGFDDMINFWNKKIKDSGFMGIYIIETLTKYQKRPHCANSSGVLEFEPMFTIGTNNYLKTLLDKYARKFLRLFYPNPYRTYDYDKVWREIVARKKNYRGKKLFKGAFTDWDNTPRFGEKSILFKNASTEKFRNYLSCLASKTYSEFIFINAWNEWAEGAHLEPDQKDGTGFLESVKKVSLSDGNPLSGL